MDQARSGDTSFIEVNRREDESHIGMLLRLASEAVDLDPVKAVRFADRARRLKPAELSIIILDAQLLLRVGRPAEALRLLEQRREPVAVLVMIEALLDLKHIEEAAARIERLLATQALDTLPGLAELARRVCTLSKNIRGWFGTLTDLSIRGEVEPGLTLSAKAGESQIEIQLEDNSGPMKGFMAAPPIGMKDAALVVTANNHMLLGSCGIWPPPAELSGWVVINDDVIEGTFRQGWSSAAFLALRLKDRIGHECEVEVLGQPSGEQEFTFSIPLSALDIEEEPYTIAARLPDGSYQPLVGSPVTRLQRLPRGQFVPPSLRLEMVTARDLDVIITVYDGREETIACIDSVLSTMGQYRFRLLVINDASPDIALREVLRRRSHKGEFTLLENTKNLGYAASINRGIAYCQTSDVVVLNADTIVHDDWIRRLSEAAYSDTDIGTVTPFGNAASIANYPSGEDDNRSIVQDGALWDSLVSSVNKGVIVDLPTGVGFCMFIKRDCIQDVGRFDDISFGIGYGEENDFCLRAKRRGWRNVAAGNIFVDHIGGRSFGERRRVLMARNRRVLQMLHGDYDGLVGRHLAADPLHRARRHLDEALLRRGSNPVVLIVTLELPGGVQRFVKSRAHAASVLGCRALILMAKKRSEDDAAKVAVRLETSDPSLKDLDYQIPSETAELFVLLRALSLERIEIHHFLGLEFSILDEIVALGAPFEIFVHDYSWVCPRITMLGGNGAYCGEPPIEQCEACIVSYGSSLGNDLSVAQLRARSAALMARARQITAPTIDTAQRMHRYVASPIRVQPWEEDEFSEQDLHPSSSLELGKRRIAVIGAIGEQKGFGVLLACAKDAMNRALPIEFIIFGYTLNDDALMETRYAFVTGRYDDQELPELLARERCDLAFFPSLTPETWCFALTAAIKSTLPIAAFDIGAIGERLRRYRSSLLLPLGLSPQCINDRLLHIRWPINSGAAYPSNSFMEDLVLAIPDPIGLRPNNQKHDALMPRTPAGQPASVTMIPVSPGLYTLTLNAQVAPIRPILSNGLLLPALQVSVAPVAAQTGRVEFTAAHSMTGNWLVRQGDALIVKVDGGDAVLLVTSLSLPAVAPLYLDMRRIDGTPGRPDAIGSHLNALRTEVPSAMDIGPETIPTALPAAKIIRTEITVHVQQRGDLSFVDAGWAGCVGKHLWIEAYTISPLETISADSIEYCAITAKGLRTPWQIGGSCCGSKGMSTPLTAFAIRPRGSQDTISCEYGGTFVSGHFVGPFKDGELCQSPLPGDPLEAIQLRIMHR